MCKENCAEETVEELKDLIQGLFGMVLSRLSTAEAKVADYKTKMKLDEQGAQIKTMIGAKDFINPNPKKGENDG